MKLQGYPEYEIYSKFIQIVPRPEDPQEPFLVEVLDGGTGRSLNVPVSQAVWNRVLGDVDPQLMRAPRNSYRFLTDCQMLCWKDKDGVIQSVDRIPVNYYQRGSSTVAALEARENGFEIEYDETVEGLIVKTVWAGMNPKELISLLDEIRKSKNLANGKIISGHRIEKIDNYTLRAVPRNLPTAA